MEDIDVTVNMKASGASGLFNEIEEMKSKRLMMKEQIDSKTEALIKYIAENGNIIAYKNDVPYILTVGSRTAIQFNKPQLSSDTGVSESDLNLVGIVRLVEDKQTSSKQLEDYYQATAKTVIKPRRAKKKDLELFRTRGQI
jgi:hypothetical protein